MAGERQLSLRGEDADAVAGALVRRQEEDGLGQIQPCGDDLHGGIVQAFAVDDDAQRVAGAGAGSEDVQLEVTACGHGGVHGMGRASLGKPG